MSFHKAKLSKTCAVTTVINRQWIGKDVGISDFLDIYVAEIYDPSKFWLLMKEHLYLLDELMDSMQ